jgi:hypothetical protein
VSGKETPESVTKRVKETVSLSKEEQLLESEAT